MQCLLMSGYREQQRTSQKSVGNNRAKSSTASRYNHRRYRGNSASIQHAEVIALHVVTIIMCMTVINS